MGCTLEAGPAAFLTLMWTHPKDSPESLYPVVGNPILDQYRPHQDVVGGLGFPPCDWSVRLGMLSLGPGLVGN